MRKITKSWAFPAPSPSPPTACGKVISYPQSSTQRTNSLTSAAGKSVLLPKLMVFTAFSHPFIIWGKEVLYIWVTSKNTVEGEGDFQQVVLCCYRTILSGAVQSWSVVSDSLQPHGMHTPGFPVLHHLPEFAQTHVHWVGDAIQPPHPLSSPSRPTFKLSQHQGLFQWVSSLH